MNKKETLYLYRLSRTSKLEYDTYDSCIVVASDEDTAKSISPRGTIYNPSERWCHGWEINPSFVMES